MKKVGELIYHPTLVKISYKVYELSVALGFAVMPKPPQEYYTEQLVKKNIKNLDKIVENVKALDLDYEKVKATSNPKGS